MAIRSFDDPGSLEARQFLLDRRCERTHPKRHRTAKRSAKARAKRKARALHNLVASRRFRSKYLERVHAYWLGWRWALWRLWLKWANGKPVSAKHEQIIRQTLIAIRHLDRGSAVETRALLLTPDMLGVSVLDLLKTGFYRDAMSRAQPRALSEQRRLPLSEAAQDARRPPAPALLLGADQERPEIPAKARVARAARTPKAG